MPRSLLDPEVVHESPRTRVTRLPLAGRIVIRKELLGQDAQRRLRHEAAVLGRLRGVPGIAQLVEAPQDDDAIVMEDAGRENLSGLAGRLAADDLIELAVRLARAVAAMHGRDVIHRDIAPANIVVSGDGAPCLVGFALATSFAEIRPEFMHHSEIVGTLAYLAPEQTGRTGRPVDQRADLYAMGATLYELATGDPPFGSGDELRLIHDHLARVPVPPAEANAAVPAALSEIVMHLLEKEPDRRYQSADGVLYDLGRLRDAPTASLRIAERDVPPRLLPPSRLVGRDEEVAALQAAFEHARAGGCRGVLVAGAPGVGKTALVNELRPAVTGTDGWFVAGKFDEYRRDLESDGVYQALRALGRLLLAESEDELTRVRRRILAALGAGAGLATAVIPEFEALLGVPPDPGDPMTAQVRAQRNSVQLLRAIASRERPVVMFIDDLQWAGRTPLGFVDLVLSEEPIDGLLLVAAFREGDVDAAHPLAAPLSLWRDESAVRHLHLENLPAPSLVTMIAEMLHVDGAAAAGLLEVIEPHTSGNPYDTVELLNALRRDGMLTATAAGWRWDGAAIRRHLGRSEVAGLRAAALDALPPEPRKLVEAMACLGGRAELDVLQVATAEPASVVEQRLAPALEEGLLVLEPGAHPAVRFRHDRVRETILAGLDPAWRRTAQLTMARQLAAAPELFAVAAEQYLPVADAVDDPAERQRVVSLLRRAADQAALIGDYALVNVLLAAAIRLIDAAEIVTLIELRARRHAALFSLGRLEEADEELRRIEGLPATAVQRAEVTTVQVRSLTHRNRVPEGVSLGVESLRELGIDMPDADRLRAEVDRQFDHLYRWLDHTDVADDLARPDITEPRLLAACRLINAIVPSAYFVADHATMSWLSLEALRVWIEHGPSPTLLGPVCHCAFAAIVLRGDYAAGHRAMQRVLAVGEARGYEPDTSQARLLFALLASWSEPIENGVQAARQAREGLIAGGDLANAGYSFPAELLLLDCAPSLDGYVAELEAGLAFVRRTGDGQTAQWLETYRWLAGVLSGERSADAVPTEMIAGNPLALLFAHLNRALAAAIFGDLASLTRDAAATMPPLPTDLAYCNYPTAVAHLLRGLTLAEQARTTDGDERGGLLSELDDVTRWLADRAADAPANFLHLQRLLEAERAWAAGDFRAAVLGFDAARRAAGQQQRPWHRGLISERAAQFFRAHGVERLGDDLIVEARHAYREWGATAKVAQLDWAYPTLRPATTADGRTAVTTGRIDLLGILSVSQALSSETSIERLHGRVVEVLGAMTGATDVHLVLWSEDREDWVFPGDDASVPLSVLRYVQRTEEPLIVGDATTDDRFARDPHFAGVTVCSVLAVPIVSRGALRAVLTLENRLIRDGFTTERLEAVKLIAGQLAVSLDNAQLYTEHRRIADEQAALRWVATLVAQGAGPAMVFDAVAVEIERLLAADRVTLARYGASAPSARPVTAIADEGEGVVEAPIVVEGRPWGVARAEWARGASPPVDSAKRMSQFTGLLETAIANADSRDQLTASRARLVTEADEARRRVVRDLHDGAQQRLVHTVITLELAQRALQRGDGEADALIAEALDHAQRANHELRELAHGILPEGITRGGLPAGIEAVVERLDLPVDVDLPAERLPREIEASVYFIVAEALTNVVKHARARSAKVVGFVRDGALHVEVRDDGVGGADPGGHGLLGMADRVTALGGQLTVESPPDGGTLVAATVPIARG
jgi:signal transduction histidine kinase